MSILSDRAIFMARAEGKIAIEPFRPECLGSNSYDVHLGKTLAVYMKGNTGLDARKDNPVRYFEIPPDGTVLNPGTLYLGVTEEYTECGRQLLPTLDGKSSGGRLGIRIHATAGKGDAGFCGYWTLEIDVIHRVRVYAGMPIGQLTWEPIEGWVECPYSKKASAKYQNQDPRPMPSRMYRNWSKKERSWTPDAPLPKWMEGETVSLS